MVLLINGGGEDVASFVIQLNFLYLKKDFRAFEQQVIWKMRELLKEENDDSLQRLYWSIDPVYQLIYYDIKTKTSSLSRQIEQIIELGSLPLYKMSAKDRKHHLAKLAGLLASPEQS